MAVIKLTTAAGLRKAGRKCPKISAYMSTRNVAGGKLFPEVKGKQEKRTPVFTTPPSTEEVLCHAKDEKQKGGPQPVCDRVL